MRSARKSFQVSDRFDNVAPFGAVTDCQFRHVPPPRCEEDELSGEVWYSVAKNDVFPETFAPFLLGHPRVRAAFLRHHAELLTPEFWQEHQARIRRGEVIDFYPYGTHRRFDNNGGVAGAPELVDARAARHDTPAGPPDALAPLTPVPE